MFVFFGVVTNADCSGVVSIEFLPFLKEVFFQGRGEEGEGSRDFVLS